MFSVTFFLPHRQASRYFTGFLFFKEKLENANPNAGAFRFYQELHITEWNASRNDETIVGSYLNWTNDTIKNSYKQLFRSDRVAPGGVWTHQIREFYKPYKEYEQCLH